MQAGSESPLRVNISDEDESCQSDHEDFGTPKIPAHGNGFKSESRESITELNISHSRLNVSEKQIYDRTITLSRSERLKEILKYAKEPRLKIFDEIDLNNESATDSSFPFLNADNGRPAATSIKLQNSHPSVSTAAIARSLVKENLMRKLKEMRHSKQQERKRIHENYISSLMHPESDQESGEEICSDWSGVDEDPLLQIRKRSISSCPGGADSLETYKYQKPNKESGSCTERKVKRACHVHDANKNESASDASNSSEPPEERDFLVHSLDYGIDLADGSAEILCSELHNSQDAESSFLLNYCHSDAGDTADRENNYEPCSGFIEPMSVHSSDEEWELKRTKVRRKILSDSETDDEMREFDDSVHQTLESPGVESTEDMEIDKSDGVGEYDSPNGIVVTPKKYRDMDNYDGEQENTFCKEILAGESARHRKLKSEFIEEEAALSGSDIESDDEEENGELDVYEEEGVDDASDNEATTRRVHRKWLKDQQDEDDRKLLLMKEKLLVDDEEYSYRRFRYEAQSNIPEDDSTKLRCLDLDEDDGDSDENGCYAAATQENMEMTLYELRSGGVSSDTNEMNLLQSAGASALRENRITDFATSKTDGKHSLQNRESLAIMIQGKPGRKGVDNSQLLTIGRFKWRMNDAK